MSRNIPELRIDGSFQPDLSHPARTIEFRLTTELRRTDCKLRSLHKIHLEDSARTVMRNTEWPSPGTQSSVPGPVFGASVLEGLTCRRPMLAPEGREESEVWSTIPVHSCFAPSPPGVCRQQCSSSGVCWQLVVCLSLSLRCGLLLLISRLGSPWPITPSS